MYESTQPEPEPAWHDEVGQLEQDARRARGLFRSLIKAWRDYLADERRWKS